MSLFSRGARLK